jgi:hypothetical protein
MADHCAYDKIWHHGFKQLTAAFVLVSFDRVISDLPDDSYERDIITQKRR